MSFAFRLVAISVVCAAVGAAQGLAYPEEQGPLPVGVTSLQLDDLSRTDPELGPRPLRTEIWYPAPDSARGLPRNLYSDFVLRGAVPGSISAAEEALGGYRKGITIAELDRTYKNVALRDAPVRDGKWPVIVFSHGSGGTRVGYVFLTEFLASHGYIVIAADHIGNSRYTIVNNRVVTAGGSRGQASAADRPKDVSFLIDAFTKMVQGSDGRFAGRADLERIGAAGMSFGGSTTINVIERDKRVKAAVMLAPGGPTGDRANFTTPVCMMIGTEDSTIREAGNARNRAYYEASKGPHYLVEIKDGGHYTFTSVEQYNPNYGNGIGKGKRITIPDQEVTYLSPEESHRIVNAYTLAFFGMYLRGQSGYRGYLQKNHFGERILYKFGE
ncbi:MAG TPA: dienelactone hydrolase family protein [Bryobacteraceae bacterium]|nr:dienelactone hydrolase family protein [Bryobacteraceae bacterium]